MSNTLSFGQVLTRKMLAVLTSNCPVTRSLNHDYEKIFPNGGYDGQKAGPAIYIRKPTQRTVRRTWGMSTTPSITETTVTLTPDQIFGTDLSFTDLELATKVDDYFERYVAPDIKKVSASVEAYNINYMLNAIYNCEAYTSLAVPTTLAHGIMTARAKMLNALCPVDGQNFVVSPGFEASIIPALAGQYNPQGNISDMYVKGQMATAVGLDWYPSQNLPGITTGSTTATTPAVGTFVSTAKTSLPFTGATTSGTWKIGQTISITGLYNINFESKVAYSQLKQFVITADVTNSSGTGTLTVSPEINFDTTDPAQNCYIASGSINSAVIIIGARLGVTSVPTTESTTYQQNLMFHRDSFAWAGVPLTIPEKAEVAGVATDVRTGLSIRYIKMYDIVNSRMLNRVDVLGGICALYPQWACKFWTV